MERAQPVERAPPGPTARPTAVERARPDRPPAGPTAVERRTRRPPAKPLARPQIPGSTALISPAPDTPPRPAHAPRAARAPFPGDVVKGLHLKNMFQRGIGHRAPARTAPTVSQVDRPNIHRRRTTRKRPSEDCLLVSGQKRPSFLTAADTRSIVVGEWHRFQATHKQTNKPTDYPGKVSAD